MKKIDSKCYWTVKPPHGYSDDYQYGQAVARDAFIRLEHHSWRKNLHSHPSFRSPVSSQGEVTLYGSDGFGDLNDNWRVEIEEKAVLETGLRFRLIHTITNLALHSHDAPHTEFTSNEQEVTGYPDRDGNDFWVVEAVHGPIVMPQFSANAKASGWLSVLNLAASIASITGITLMFLGTSLKTASLARLLSTLFATILSLGIATTIMLLLLEAHRILRLRLRSKLWVFAMWMTGGSLGFVALLYLWRVVFKSASPEVEKLLQDLFGLR